MDYNDSSRQFRPLGSRVMALSIKCDSLALVTESREEWIFPNEINYMSVWEWWDWERKYSETVVGINLMLVLSTGRLYSLNLSLRQKLPKIVLKTVLVSTFLAVLKSLYCAYLIACSSMVSSRA